MHSFNLATEPWIPVLTTQGMRTVALPEAFAPDVVAVATGDDLEDLAVSKMLLAVAIAADVESTPAQDWVRAHVEDFDLFHPARPFGQNADMARFLDVEDVVKPILHHSYRHAGRGGLASNQFHSYSGVSITPAEAARILLVRQSFSVTGVQQFKKGLFPSQRHPGKGKQLEAVNGYPSVYVSRAFAWIVEDTLDLTLAANVAAVRDLPKGRFQFTWTDGHPPLYLAPEGVLDGLTYLSRSVYLVPGTSVDQAIVCEGLRWPAADDNVGYTADQAPTLLPFTLFKMPADKPARTAKAPKRTAPATPPVTIEKTPWRQLLDGLATQQPVTAALASARPGQRVTVAGLATSSGGRLDGTLTGTLPVPADGVDAAAIAELVDTRIDKHVTLLMAQRTQRGRDASQDAEKKVRKALRMDITHRLDELMYPHVVAALDGKITLEELDTLLTSIVAAADHSSIASLAQTRPQLAARTAFIRDAMISKKNADSKETSA